jgi:nitrogen fixation/metabolism regulation signal transduction histidine kinase
LRDKLLLLFLVATLLPLGATLLVSWRLLDQSLDIAPVAELEESTQQLEAAGRTLYQTSRQLLRERVENKKVQVEAFPSIRLEAGEPERFVVDGEDLVLLRAEGGYRLKLDGVRLPQLQAKLAEARQVVEAHRDRDLKRGFFLTLASVAGTIWLIALVALLYLTNHITRPIRELTQALRAFTGGKRVPLEVKGHDEVAQAIVSFNDMSEQLDRNRERLLYFTRLESWQTLARKMAHEVKNSLTPIRLTVEEMVARSHPEERAFLEQASQIVTEEVQSLERRVRAFSELSSEPPLELMDLDVNALVEERIAFLRSAHPEVIYRKKLDARECWATADPDLLRGILTNLLENAAHAAGVIQVSTRCTLAHLEIVVEDSGPGLSLLAQETLFQPTISFKRSGMGLGLSIAKRSAVVMGGDLELVTGSLGGAAFRIQLKKANPQWQNESLSLTTKKISAVPSV